MVIDKNLIIRMIRKGNKLNFINTAEFHPVVLEQEIDTITFMIKEYESQSIKRVSFPVSMNDTTFNVEVIKRENGQI